MISSSPFTVNAEIGARLSELFPVDDWLLDAFDYVGSHNVFDDAETRVTQTGFVEGRLFNVDVEPKVPGDEPATMEQSKTAAPSSEPCRELRLRAVRTCNVGWKPLSSFSATPA